VTHNLEGRDYKGIDPNKLVDVLHRIADKTNKPVTTTLRPDSYRTYPEVTAASDFLFPDLHGEWYSQADPGELRFETRKLVDQMTGIRNDHYSDKPILIKMVSFPTCDARGASETAQRRFFNLIHQDLISSASAPARVYVSYFAAFDPRWKTPPDFEPGEVCIGLLKEGPSGTFVARPAVSEIMKKR
jgi:exo-beta-1,3-glucanase (GH17 family)